MKVLLGPVLELKTAEPIPKGTVFSVRHSLHIPEKSLFKTNDRDTHHIVRIIKETKDKEFTSENMTVEVVEEFNWVTSPFFSTDKLTQFCFITATCTQECRHSTKMYLSFLRRKHNQSCPHPTAVFCYSENDREAFIQNHLMEHGHHAEAMVPHLLNLSRCHDYSVYLASNEKQQTWLSWAASFSPWHVPGHYIGSLDHDDVLNSGTVRIAQLRAFPLDDCRNPRQVK